jgi:hypothetical protein
MQRRYFQCDPRTVVRPCGDEVRAIADYTAGYAEALADAYD